MIQSDLLGPIALSNPIWDKNRDEYILLPFEGFIKNVNECILCAIIKDEEKWGHIFQNYHLFLEDIDLRFNLTMCGSIDYFIEKLIGKTISAEELTYLKHMILSEISFADSHTTIMEVGLSRILEQEFVKKVYIIDDDMPDIYITYLQKAFPRHISKMNGYRGSYLKAFGEIPQITTCGVISLETLFQIFEKVEDKKKLETIYFLLPLLEENFSLKPEISDKIFNFLIEKSNKNKAYIEYIRLGCIPEESIIERAEG